jgi:hypothetical protein
MKNPYLTRPDAIYALSKMSKFHDELMDVMHRNGFDMLDNLGRRNILMSAAQEKFFAEALARRFNVTCDGKTGEPDIVIHTLDRELECKLTSRQKSGAISFQTDYETLAKKKSLDYLYVVASKDFDEFAVVLYENLTISDFRFPSPGSRGKSQLMKHRASDRAKILVGNFENVNDRELKKLKNRLTNLSSTRSSRDKTMNSINYWKSTPTKYSINLESINNAKC